MEEMSSNLASYYECSKLRQEVRVVLEKLDPHNYLNGKCSIKIEPGTGAQSGLKLEDIKCEFSRDSWSYDTVNADEHSNSGVKFEPEEGNRDDENDESNSSGSGICKKKSRKKGTKIQCDICKTYFACRGNFVRHHKLKHRRFPLPPYIRPTYRNSNNKNTQILEKLIDPQNPLKCPYCQKIFKTANYLRIHIRIHRPPGMEYYSCNFCGQRFSHHDSWKQHVSKHSEEAPYSCKKCDFTTKYRTSIYAHEKICCDFKLKDEMIKKNRLLFHCDLCGKPFKSEVGVHNHKLITGENCKIFACNICGRKFYRESMFREHESVAHNNEFPFPCPLCDSKFKLKGGLQSHTRHAHVKNWACTRVGCTAGPFETKNDWRSHLRICSSPIQCTTCEQIFDSRETYSVHSHPIHCEKCDKTYPKKSQMDLHVAYHDPLNVHKCGHCTFGFSSLGELTTHLKMSHKKDNLLLANFIVRSAEDIYYFTCKFCEAEFENPSLTELNSHTKSTHSDKIGQFICPDCGKGFNTELKCFLHRNRVHGPVETDFKCEICVLYFLTNHGLDVHKNKTHYEIPLVELAVTLETSQNSEEPETFVTLDKFSCLICGKKCWNKASLTRHMTIHRMDREFKCELCVRSWTTAENFNHHNRAQHSDLQLEPVQPKILECRFCEKTFNSPANLRMHTRIHTKEKPYKCEVCDKRFTTPDNQRKHMVIHTGEKSKSCDFCGMAFARNGERNMHIKRFHKIDA